MRPESPQTPEFRPESGSEGSRGPTDPGLLTGHPATIVALLDANAFANRTIAELLNEIARLHKALAEQTDQHRRWRNRAQNARRKATQRQRFIEALNAQFRPPPKETP